MTRYVLFALMTFATSISFAQEETEVPDPAKPVVKPGSNRILGKIIDEKTRKAIDAASLQLYVLRNGALPDSLIRAKVSKANGDFEFSDLPPADSFRLFVSAIGFGSFNQYFSFGGNNSGVMEKDLGNIALSESVQQLAEVTVTDSRSAMQMAVDRRIFNVERSLTATGGTAIDVIKNIPSLSVDAEGNVSLRNNTPQVFVDGRPTILTLDQIPADNIERIEIITNPSAKFDAASTAGIVNIILKKNRRVGLNGIASLGAGYPDILNGSINLNTRQGKINVFLSANYNQSGGISNGKTFRQNLQNGAVANYFNQVSEDERTRKFNSFRFGLDYFIDNRNTFSVSQNIVNGDFTGNEDQDQEYLDAAGIMERFGLRTSESISSFDRYNSQLNFTHKFPEQGRQLTTDLSFNYGKGSNFSDIYNAFYFPDNSFYEEPTRVNNSGGNRNNQYTFQIDYADPIGEDGKLELGARRYQNNFRSNFLAIARSGGVTTILPLTNNIEYTEVVNAAYVTYSNKLTSTVSYQAGLRAELSSFEGKLPGNGETFGYKLPSGVKNIFDGLFPSLFLTKALNDDTEVQLNYSRRIRRPNFWQLNPFININDPVNITVGNPALRPEFTNSFELNYNRQYNKGDFLAAVYYRNNQGDITRYSDTITAAQLQQLDDAAVDPNAILNTFVNAQATNRIGAEFVLQHKFSNHFDITPSVDLQYRKVIVPHEKLNLSNDGFNWEVDLAINYKIQSTKSRFLNDFSFQLSGEYESPEIRSQGKSIAEYSADFAIRKEFLQKKKATVTFSVNDIFWTDRRGSVVETERFFQDSYRRNVRSFRISFSYKFGSADLQLFNRNNNRDRDEEE